LLEALSVAQLRFTKNNRPFLLSGDVKSQERGIGKAWAAVLLVTGTAIVFAVLFVSNPMALLATGTATKMSTAAPQVVEQSTPAVQLPAIAEALPLASREAPTADGLIAAFKGAFDGPSEADQPSAEALFKQFQNWAAEENLRSPIPPLRGAQDARAQVVQKTPARPLPKPRPLQAAERTEMAQDDAVQNAQWPMRSFGWRN
jgi:hypothetical protein